MKITLLIMLIAATLPSLFAQQDPVIRNGERFPYVALDCSGSYDQIPAKLGVLMAEVGKQGISETAGPIVMFHNSPGEVKTENLKWTVAIPVDKSAKAAPPLRLGEYNYDQTAEMVYKGPYGSVGSVLGKLYQFIGQSGYQPCGPLCESYMDDPSQVKPEDCRTLISIPVKKK